MIREIKTLLHLVFLNCHKTNACSGNIINRIKPADIQTSGLDPAIAVSTLDNRIPTDEWKRETF